MLAERHFRKLSTPDLLRSVYYGEKLVKGECAVESTRTRGRPAA